MTGGTGMKKNIGIDIGGTKVLMGVVDGQGTVHAEKDSDGTGKTAQRNDW